MEEPMTMLKTDYPRAIDRVIDYFGERRPARTTAPPRPGTAALGRVA
jgi:hypothetical protein